jgi:dTDP-glucose pyrophosphorylase
MIKKYSVSTDCTVKDAIEQMTANNIKAVVVVDDSNVVKGLFSNGDMRTFFLKGGSLSAGILEAMNPDPILYSSRSAVEKERKRHYRVIYPIIDTERRLVDVIDGYELATHTVSQKSQALEDVPLVIMAGGKGTRLYPYTKILPKPLIPIGDITITERIIETFTNYGCKEVHMVLNYKANMIKAYMNDVEKDYTVSYVDEDKFLGTGGGLQLLKGKINKTFILSNCDTLLDADYECAYLTHKAKKNKVTFIGAMKDMVIPYGVLETNDDGSISAMKEKPDYSYLVNTGVYVIEPDVIDAIEKDEFIGLPDLAKRMMDRGERVGVFPISEKAWMDMGQFSEMESMLRSLGIS